MEKLPIENESGFIGRIKKFFRNLFYKEEKTFVEDQHSDEKKIVNISKSNVFDEMRKEYKSFESKKLIIDKTVKNPELIKDLSEENKKKLDELYDKKIEENNKIIIQNNKKIADLEARLNKLYIDIL